MEETYRQAFTEVDIILSLMPNVLVKKIPEKLRSLIKKEKSKNYNPIIKEPIEDFKLKEETLIILSLIYRDFLCDENKKNELKARDKKQLEEEEKELSKKYNSEGIFENRKISQINSEKRELIVKEEKWYKKIYNFIKNVILSIDKRQ